MDRSPLARAKLEEAGVDLKAVDIVFRAADGYDDSIPGAGDASDDAAGDRHDMASRCRRPRFPGAVDRPADLRMDKNVKWVERIEAITMITRATGRHADGVIPLHQIWGRIDTPASGEQIPAGPAVAAGVASAGDRGIFRVEISLDEGATWADATLEPSINPDFTWVRWCSCSRRAGRPRTS